MQFAGVLDNNGKEVFEGDVLKDDSKRILLVEYWKCSFTLKAITETNFIRAFCIMQWFEDKRYIPVIIGNIYETPELLERDTLCACKEVKDLK